MSQQARHGDPSEEHESFGCLAGGGEMGAHMRGFDWASTPLGPVSRWPQSLRTAVSILLSSRHPMFIWWGPELVQFYNDGYRPSLGEHKHPSALGQRGKECWAEIWPIIGPQIEGVMANGQETWHEDQLVPFDRNGYREEIYFTYGYSPIRDESGGVGGTLVVCTETTQRVLGERRLRESQAELRLAKEAAEAANQAKDRFIAALSHELRTPLTPVLAVVSRLLGESRLDGGLREELAMIQRNIEIESLLIDDLLDLTRISGGKPEPRREKGGLPPEIGEVLESRPGTAAPAPAPDHSLHVLLVEDHEDTAFAMAELMRSMGHRVTTAGSVGEGLAAAASEEGAGIDLVVSDLGLPDGHGNQLMRELKSRHGLAGIALSGYGMEEDVRESREAGFDRHLTKPIGIRALEEALREAANRVRA